ILTNPNDDDIDDFFENGLKSIHESSGAFSAAVSNLEKNSLFGVDEIKDKRLITDSMNLLNDETGLDFFGYDAARLGDLEFLVFPTMDERERNLFYVSWGKKNSIISISLDQSKYHVFDDFQFKISLINDNNNVHSIIVNYSYVPGRKIEFDYEVPDYLTEIIDGTRVEVFAKKNTDKEFFLYSQYGVGYIREISLKGQINPIAGQVKSSWLSKHASSYDKDRIRRIETIKQRSIGFESIIGGRTDDPWVPINRNIRNTISKYKEFSSDGRFFDQYKQGEGSGRIEFAEWYKDVVHSNPECIVFVFDPYFEDVGISLLAPNACSDTEYIIFTTRKRLIKLESISFLKKVISTLREYFSVIKSNNVVGQERINNLLASCEKLKPLLERIKIKIYALPPIASKKPAFHDRYILVLDNSGLPIKGFHLSNSIQKAAENYPLLITPIPNDVLAKVVE
ncbi:MAG: hypothetical protein KAR20_25495, partial [Candidatus Heimdallarchaeota archaeon]|nr:hypothetical protein [Candidatus Heimdallarchaeota archaeon]